MRTIPKEILEKKPPSDAKWIAQDRDGWWTWFEQEPFLNYNEKDGEKEIGQWIWLGNDYRYQLIEVTTPPSDEREMLFTIEEFNQLKKELK